MKNSIILLLIFFITSGSAYACPMCMGTNPNDKYYLYVIGVFILLIYFPMFYMFKTFMKFKNINNSKETLPSAQE
jgi:phosphotransferase system  glucose/maltose/N-acetylglucosamine-specific IIC component